jgi:hypothetical protein
MTTRSFSGNASIAFHSCAALTSRNFLFSCRGRWRLIEMGGFARGAPPIRSLPTQREAPRHAHQPRAEGVPIAKLPEAVVRFGECLLRDVFGVFTMPQHAVGDAEGERRGFSQTGFKLPFELGVHGYKAGDGPGLPLVHRFVPATPFLIHQTPSAALRFSGA